GWMSFKDEARAACQRRVEVVAVASLKRRTDHARRAGCCGGGCLLEMGPPGIVNDVSTARLEDLSVGFSVHSWPSPRQIHFGEPVPPEISKEVAIAWGPTPVRGPDPNGYPDSVLS
ncbi:MAG: hypothetical protein ACJA2W_004078, partial [Planctomycetota bacterium]